MEILIILALVILVILIVGYPLVTFQPLHNNGLRTDSLTEYEDLYGAREAAFEALRDLQFEFATGKLSQRDYDSLRVRYEAQAADILRQVDALKPRAKKGAAGAKHCTRCGAPLGGNDRFCTKCGARA